MAEAYTGKHTGHRAVRTRLKSKSVSSTLSALRAKAGKDRKYRFRSLARLLDRQMLGEDWPRSMLDTLKASEWGRLRPTQPELFSFGMADFEAVASEQAGAA